MKPKHPCHRCLGRGRVDCSECGSDVPCTECNETGVNDDIYNTQAIEERECEVGAASSCALIEGGVVVGRAFSGTDYVLRFDDFLREP